MSNLDVLTYGFAFTSDQGGLGWSTISLLTTGNRRILIDTGPASRRALLADALRSRNLDFEDVDTVILTHMHWDHCQNTDLFPNARILVHPKELGLQPQSEQARRDGGVVSGRHDGKAQGGAGV